MNDLMKKLLAGVVSGLVAAAQTDWNAYKTHPEGFIFDWKVARRRYAIGAVGGLLAAAGLDGLAH